MEQYQLFQSIISLSVRKISVASWEFCLTAKKVDGNMGSKKARCITIPDKNFNLLQYRAADRLEKCKMKSVFMCRNSKN